MTATEDTRRIVADYVGGLQRGDLDTSPRGCGAVRRIGEAGYRGVPGER
jgi:hypothetical protein